jgi:hypothetical protein
MTSIVAIHGQQTDCRTIALDNLPQNFGVAGSPESG